MRQQSNPNVAQILRLLIITTKSRANFFRFPTSVWGGGNHREKNTVVALMKIQPRPNPKSVRCWTGLETPSPAGYACFSWLPTRLHHLFAPPAHKQYNFWLNSCEICFISHPKFITQWSSNYCIMNHASLFDKKNRQLAPKKRNPFSPCLCFNVLRIVIFRICPKIRL